MPAASSSTRRRSSGRAPTRALTRPWLTIADDRAPPARSANSACTSRPHLLPVGAVRAAGAALDAADHLHFRQPGERRGEVPFKRQRHLGAVVAGAGCGAGEDHVVHLGAAQRPGAALSHRPAQRVGHVALAAAVGSHDAREAGQDGELHRVGEALEASDAAGSGARPGRSGEVGRWRVRPSRQLRRCRER